MRPSLTTQHCLYSNVGPQDFLIGEPVASNNSQVKDDQLNELLMSIIC